MWYPFWPGWVFETVAATWSSMAKRCFTIIIHIICRIEQHCLTWRSSAISDKSRIFTLVHWKIQMRKKKKLVINHWLTKNLISTKTTTIRFSPSLSNLCHVTWAVMWPPNHQWWNEAVDTPDCVPHSIRLKINSPLSSCSCYTIL